MKKKKRSQITTIKIPLELYFYIGAGVFWGVVVALHGGSWLTYLVGYGMLAFFITLGCGSK